MEHLNRGFRLHKFEVLNWGTFDKQIWAMNPEMENSLLTGNIGSGKSTLVDGLTTLMVPTRKLAFNKAAGAEEKERSLESYFHGYYTSVQDESGKARAMGLRDGNRHISVLLAVFRSDALEEDVSLAQVLWLKPGERKVKRLFVVASRSLSISKHFSGFGSQIQQLRKKLRKKSDVEIFDSFGPYSQAFSKLMGLGSDGKALELFNQTISMKSVGSVTDFVRQNMLEHPDIESQLQALEQNYDDLKRLHDAVVAARNKVELLQPVDKYGREAIDATNEKQKINQARDLTDAYVADMAVALYQKRIQKYEQELKQVGIRLRELQELRDSANSRITQLREQIHQNGGGRLQQLESEISQAEIARDDAKRLYDNYQRMARQLELSDELQAETFITNIASAKDILEDLQEQDQRLEEQQFDCKTESNRISGQKNEISLQLQALKRRKSNISFKQLQIRELLCRELGIDESHLPFVGELLQVKPEEELWQGAIERVLHNFALSLMVPEELYGKVAQLVESTHLGTRLVYYRVRQPQHTITFTPDGDSLLNKVAIKPDSDYFDWLQQELQQRFNYLCCEDMAEFRRADRAITPKGQVKTSQFRHEKDDRHNILDKSRYVLGWSNREKIELLAKQLQKLEQELGVEQKKVNQLTEQRKILRTRSAHAQNLADYTLHFEQINWPVFANRIRKLEEEKQQLETSSDLLRELQEQLEAEQQKLRPIEDKRDNKLGEKGRLETQLESDKQALQSKHDLLAEVDMESRKAVFPVLEETYEKYIKRTVLRIDGLEVIAKELRVKLNERIQHLEAKHRQRLNQMVTAMSNFAHAFPNEVEELDRTFESLPEYQQLLKQLQEEDLPKHEARFKEMLNRDTIRAMALFRSQLDKQEEAIRDRISLINSALRELDYQPGTYIEIDTLNSQDIDVRDFQQRLKLCLEGESDVELYSEERFLRVKDLIEQMRREPRWTQKVVDVRYWKLFNVVERYREDDQEKECYSDSGGKSGGQKEKLAYSILAAAILLQYGLVDRQQHINSRAKRRFNLVVIDEAFARGSKDSTRFGLELFKQLGLQLLLVTPLQKLDVIEHYVSHVHFVDLQNDRSKLLNMSIEEYQAKKQAELTKQSLRQLVHEHEHED